jgi:hypothetical protein
MSGRNLRPFAAAFLLTLLAAGPAAALPSGAATPAAGWLDPLRQLLQAAWESLTGDEGGSLDPNGLTGDEGGSLDPNGLTGEEGGSLDPNG